MITTFYCNLVFTVKRLDKLPSLKVESPPQKIAELPRRGTSDWQLEPRSVRNLCEDILQRINYRVDERQIFLKPFFKNYDKYVYFQIVNYLFLYVIA